MEEQRKSGKTNKSFFLPSPCPESAARWRQRARPRATRRSRTRSRASWRAGTAARATRPPCRVSRARRGPRAGHWRLLAAPLLLLLLFVCCLCSSLGYLGEFRLAFFSFLISFSFFLSVFFLFSFFLSFFLLCVPLLSVCRAGGIGNLLVGHPFDTVKVSSSLPPSPIWKIQ